MKCKTMTIKKLLILLMITSSIGLANAGEMPLSVPILPPFETEQETLEIEEPNPTPSPVMNANPLYSVITGTKVLTTAKVVVISGDIQRGSKLEYERQMFNTLALPGHRLIIIKSTGGYSSEGQGIIDLMAYEQTYGVKMICVADETAYSMAFNILSRCDVRFATPNTTLVFHSVAFVSLDGRGERLTPARLRKVADDLEKDDNVFKAVNMKALHMTNKDYDMYSANDHEWTVDALIKRKYLHGVVLLKKSY